MTTDTKAFDITDAGDTARRFYIAGQDGKDVIHTIANNDAVLKANWEDRKDSNNGFTSIAGYGRVRQIGRIDMNTVRLLKCQNDPDATAYLDTLSGTIEHQTAMMNLIRRYPEYFKTCSGGV